MQRLPQGRLEEELAKAEERRDPPVPVWAVLPVDGVERPGELHGWASNPKGGADGLRGLVVAVREYAPGFETEYLGWVRADQIRQRDA